MSYKIAVVHGAGEATITATDPEGTVLYQRTTTNRGVSNTLNHAGFACHRHAGRNLKWTTSITDTGFMEEGV